MMVVLGSISSQRIVTLWPLGEAVFSIEPLHICPIWRTSEMINSLQSPAAI